MNEGVGPNSYWFFQAQVKLCSSFFLEEETGWVKELGTLGWRDSEAHSEPIDMS